MAELTVDQALQRGIEAHKAGRVQVADRFYKAILKAVPNHSAANHNMGLLASGLGNLKEALPFLMKALETNSSVEQYWVSYVDTLVQLGQIKDAQEHLEKAESKGLSERLIKRLEDLIATRDNNPTLGPSQEIINELINLYNEGQLTKTVEQAQTLSRKYPDAFIVWNILGAAQQGLGKVFEAIQTFENVTALNPNYADGFNNLGVALQDEGKLDEAVEAYNKALAINPHYAEAHNNLGNALKDQGELEEAIEAYNNALLLNPDYALAQKNMGNALKGLTFSKPSSNLQQRINSILNNKTYVRPNDISSAAISLLKFEPAIKVLCKKHSQGTLSQSFEKIILALSDIPLLLNFMSVCPLHDLELEAAFTKIRSNFLETALENSENPDLLNFQSALALQCFTNEYVYGEHEIETKAVQRLEVMIEKALLSGKQPSPTSLLCLSSYRALNKYDWCNLINITSDIETVFKRQILQTNQQALLKSRIPVLRKITNKISSSVKKQYEENPYPRWVNLEFPLTPSSISKVVGQLNLRLFDYAIYEVKAPNILIAGCGTGQHSIGTAASYKNSKVLAIDLSSSSLAYAKLKTEEFGLKNIEYMQADILDIRKLDRQFDLIESVGVLHHLDNPMEGWKMLTDCLKQGGLMKVGLYSEIARQSVKDIRREIEKSEIDPNNMQMRVFRSKIIQSDAKNHKEISSWTDFYTLSEFRDLLFHEQEHLFTISQIKNCLEELGLKFCGFEQKNIIQKFKSNNTGKGDPYDLSKWETYEYKNPKTFAGMYQFWCQKIN